MNKKQKKMLMRILLASCGMIIIPLLPADGLFRFCLYMVPYLIAGYDILLRAGRGIANRQVFDENFLMAVATIGAICIAISGQGDYTEAIAVMLFYQIGELFQSYAVGKSRRSISQLMDIRPDYANIEVNGVLEQVDPDEVDVGTEIIIQPGEKVPLDGIVLDGTSALDASALTGESLPRDITAGDEISSGCINLSGLLRVRTTKPFGESTVSKILDLVENASSLKSKSETFIARFAHVYTPAVCYSALVLATLPPLVRLLILGLSPAWGDWIYRALTFLVISCPCALVISIPLTFFAGIGGAGNAGVLVKGSNYLEALAQTEIVVLDKTGTLTNGVFAVQSIQNTTIPESLLLEYAAHAESASSHPISKSLQQAYGNEINRSRVTGIQEYSGEGIVAMVDTFSVAAGNHRLMARFGIEPLPCHKSGTLVHVAIDQTYAGCIVIADNIKHGAKDALDTLKTSGICRIVMLTGDLDSAAQAVAAELGIHEVRSQLLPGDKVAQVESLLMQKSKKGKLAFVGDGINDAPVLARADIGIAMGAMGSDAAIEAADVVLMDDDPRKLSKAIRIARKCMVIVQQNIVFAIGVKFLCLLLGALGLANMWLAIFADVGVMVLAVLNAIRALFVKKL